MERTEISNFLIIRDNTSYSRNGKFFPKQGERNCTRVWCRFLCTTRQLYSKQWPKVDVTKSS